MRQEPTPSSLKAHIERPADVAATPRSSDTRTLVHLVRVGPLDRPVDLAHALKACGLTLSEAHGANNELAEIGSTVVAMTSDVMPDLLAFGVRVDPYEDRDGFRRRAER